jgi:hypothetical protein
MRKTPGAVWFVAGSKDADAVGTKIGAGVTYHKTVTLETPLTLKVGPGHSAHGEPVSARHC